MKDEISAENLGDGFKKSIKEEIRKRSGIMEMIRDGEIFEMIE